MVKKNKWVAKRKGVKIISQKPLTFTVSSKTLSRTKSWKIDKFVKKT